MQEWINLGISIAVMVVSFVWFISRIDKKITTTALEDKNKIELMNQKLHLIESNHLVHMQKSLEGIDRNIQKIHDFEIRIESTCPLFKGKECNQ
jgi:hypothetical protein